MCRVSVIACRNRAITWRITSRQRRNARTNRSRVYLSTCRAQGRERERERPITRDSCTTRKGKENAVHRLSLDLGTRLLIARFEENPLPHPLDFKLHTLSRESCSIPSAVATRCPVANLASAQICSSSFIGPLSSRHQLFPSGYAGAQYFNEGTRNRHTDTTR